MLFLTMVKFFLSSISFKALIVVNNFRDVRDWAPNRSREPGNENPAKSPQALCQRLSARRAAILPGTRAGGRGRLDSSRLPDDPSHRDVTISEARDFAGFRKWRRRRCWMLELQPNFFHN